MVKHTRVKVFLINLFPFKFDKCAPKTPPKKEPSVNKISKFRGTDSILNKHNSSLQSLIVSLNKHNAPIAFQKIPTLKKVNRIALRKSIPKVLIKRIVTNKPVPDDIDPFKIAIKKISNANLRFKNRLICLFSDNKPKSDLLNE